MLRSFGRGFTTAFFPFYIIHWRVTKDYDLDHGLLLVTNPKKNSRTGSFMFFFLFNSRGKTVIGNYFAGLSFEIGITSINLNSCQSVKNKRCVAAFLFLWLPSEYQFISKWFRSFPTGYCAVSTQLWLSSTCEQKEMVGQIARLLNHQFYPCFRTKLSVPNFPVVAFWRDDSWTATTDLWSHWDTCRRKLFPPCKHFSFELSTIRRLNERNGSPYEISLEPPAD